MDPREWKIYIASDIDAPLRDAIIAGCDKKNIPAIFLGPQIEREKGDQDKLEAVRARLLIEAADLIIVAVDDAEAISSAFDAGYAAALGKPVICLIEPGEDSAAHPVCAVAAGRAETAEQVVEMLMKLTDGAVIARKKRSAGFGPS